MADFQDKTIKCVDCGEDFVFTANEQEFYAEKGFQNEPKRCKACRQAFKAQKSEKKMFPATCSECGEETTVPFEPKDPSKPIYCRECFTKKRESEQN